MSLEEMEIDAQADIKPPKQLRQGMKANPAYEKGALAFDFLAYNDHIWVSGFGESGKTVLVKTLILPIFQANNILTVVWDYNDNYDDVHLPITQDIKAVIQSLTQRKSIVYQAPVKSVQNFEKFCRVVTRFRGVEIVIEELQEYCHKQSMPDYLSAIVHTGRNAKRGYVAITQRPQEVPTVVLSNAKHRFYFKQDYDSTTEKKWLFNAIGNKALELESAVPYSYVYKLRNAHAVLRRPIPYKRQ
jgi:hypothetical protein